MSGWRLALKAAPALRVDLRGVTPTALAMLSAAQVERLPVGHGNAFVPLAEFFKVEEVAGDEALLVFDGDLSRFDRVGWQMTGGSLRVEGSVGHYAGGCMSGGELQVQGGAGLLAACEMAGGTLAVQGDVDDFAASTLPGSMDGMRGGTFIVMGNAGARFGDRMRRGSAVVHGDVGDFPASRMVAGTIAVGGRVGAHVGYGMRRGSVVLASASSGYEAPATFVPAIAAADVIWQLLARNLAQHGGPFAALASRQIERQLGDVSSGGKGELIVAK
ncbi:formylmethanofuran dehydrogenase subunit C [Variovorax sp. J22R133]|uniref:formylmethanofuran dehydrogenase subunit C n=1 Tax=Variovorax brevis TaxID=3053503 RepID=UPI0025749110|nr:formylmethanofuran dehydrogenase subunit C [Variovorax sp. J22R133]MDM0115991.1 formylmethanofuran dehydrogenase subunit C [Variovorax sp. J22R133]